MEVNGNNGNSITYILHIQKLFEEYQHLQLEYSRLRQQLNDHVILPKNDCNHFANETNDRTVDDHRAELEYEKAQVKSLQKEVTYLLDQVRKTQKLYNDLLSIKNLQDNSGERISELSAKISKIESENKDLKDINDFMTSENAVLADSVKDLEETLSKERAEWLKEKEEYEKVLKYSRNLYDKFNNSKEEIANLTTKLAEQTEMNEKLAQKYARNRKVFEDNEKNFMDEINKLDNFVAFIVETLKKLPEHLRNCPELQEMITKIDQSELDKSMTK